MAFELTRDIDALKRIATDIRKHAIEMITTAKSGHPGGSLSVAEIVTALCFGVMKHDPKDPLWEDRDRFIMSKGHCIPSWYAALAKSGYFSEDSLNELRQYGSFLQGHPCHVRMPSIEASTGSLGQGLSVALGMALAAKMDKKDYRVFSIIGDGESQEGQIWEAAMAAAHYKADNLTVILDNNNGQIDGFVNEVMPLDPIDGKWRAFNWHVIAINGHDFEQIFHALDEAADTKDRPTLIWAKTVKGKGVSFMENNPGWHGKPPSQEECEKALAELATA